jgi:hypothetical protein
MKTGSKESQNRGKQSFFTKNAKKFFQNLVVRKICFTFAPLSRLKYDKREI